MGSHRFPIEGARLLRHDDAPYVNIAIAKLCSVGWKKNNPSEPELLLEIVMPHVSTKDTCI